MVLLLYFFWLVLKPYGRAAATLLLVAGYYTLFIISPALATKDIIYHLP
jgi:hypothetical protein